MNAVAYETWRRHVLAYYACRSTHAFGKARQVLDAAGRLGVRTTADLTTTMALEFVADRGRNANPNTTRGLLSYLKASVSLAVEEGWLDRAPNWRRVTPAASPRRRNPALSGPEVAQLLGHLDLVRKDSHDWRDHRLHALTTLVSLTGLRYLEAAGLRHEDLDLAGGWLDLRPTWRALKTSSSAQPVPIPDQAVAALAEWCPQSGSDWVFPGSKRLGPWVGGMAGYRPVDRLRAAGRQCGVGHATWHGLRRTYATQAVRTWGVPVWAVQRILRHSSPRTTELYLDLDDRRGLRGMVAGARYESP